MLNTVSLYQVQLKHDGEDYCLVLQDTPPARGYRYGIQIIVILSIAAGILWLVHYFTGLERYVRSFVPNTNKDYYTFFDLELL